MHLPLRVVCVLAFGVLCAPSGFGQAVATKPAPKPQSAADSKASVTPVPRDAKWMARHGLINSRAVPGTVDVIFLGDSITQGWEGAGKEAWATHFAALKPMNAGIGGDRTQHVLWRLDNGNVDGITPKVAVLMIGTNNSGTDTSEQIAAGIRAIVAKLREKLPATKVLVLGIFPRGAGPDDTRRLVNVGANELVKSIDDGKSVFYLDIGPKFLTADGVLEKRIMPDLLHLSPEGYEIWATAIRPKLDELLRTPH
ncbi:MAG: platelet-activating factor acetylhydrolase IB subunit [Planctomycetota bacterium]|nr:platelet-activating factor acetylhydrolase IB subunit [Planctomycetota bacterium]